MKATTFIKMLLFLITIYSCSKYEEGPFISLKSKKSRLLGEWKVVEFIKDNEDLTQFYLDTCGCTIEYKYAAIRAQDIKENYFQINCPYNSWNFIGPDANVDRFDYSMCTWTFSANHEYIWLNIGFNNDTRYKWGLYPLTISRFCLYPLEILRLKNNELWVRYSDIENVYTIKFEKK